MDSLIAMGAAPGSIEVQMEIDRQKNIVSATATGSLQMEQQELALARPPRKSWSAWPASL